MWWRNSLAAPSMVTVVYIGMKCTLFDTKSTTVITALYPDDSGSSTTKFILRVSYYISRIERGWSSFTREYHMGFVLKHRSYMLIYCSIY